MLHMLHSSSQSASSQSSLSTMASSCGNEDRLVIQRPTCESFSFFDWSDFPVVQQQAVFFDASSVCAPLTANEEYASTSCCRQRAGDDDDDICPSSSFDSLRSDSTKSSNSINSSNSSNRQRRVSFADNIQIRIHSIVLGDHPCCKQLPISLGWEYDEVELTLNDNNGTIDQQKASRRGSAVRRRNYWERKDMLKRISGMTDADIKHIVTSNLHTVATAAKNLCTMSSEL